ncbi:MAG: hypothetical protein KAU50_09475 [Candidatus Marinimicrobia bacterium]|nr:hypothetical protein [Candidatus Neomarinimicrobiota bacterium]
MPVPEFHPSFTPLLYLTADGKEHSLQAAIKQLGYGLGITATANCQIRRVDSNYFIEE